MDLSWEAIGTGIALAISGGYNVWQKIQAKRAEAKVKSAEDGAAVSRAEASKEVFELVKAQLVDVTARLSAAETRIDTLQEQVRERDNRIHAMEMHIMDLERTLQQHGIPIPKRP